VAGPVLTGGCQRGAVRYRIDGPLGQAGICHCRMCQKAFGSWGAALVSVTEAQLTWARGQPSEFRSSQIVARGFCAKCGTPLHMKEDGDPTYEIAIGTLDDPEMAPPSQQAGVEAELSWFKAMPDLPRQRTQDYRTPEDLAKLRSLQHPDHDTKGWPSKC
jgi:hypothetical protein